MPKEIRIHFKPVTSDHIYKKEVQYFSINTTFEKIRNANEFIEECIYRDIVNPFETYTFYTMVWISDQFIVVYSSLFNPNAGGENV